jgi:phosphoenolpyruvate synthase/pyruvate phosphate dikinase
MRVSRLKGTPTSQGYYRGPVKVVKGLEDFHKVQQGDVLVVPFTDVGWTPLFARAGAVVAESGGILSHSSIIAREYHIPAVVSVQGATLLKDGMLVAVDGYQGEVLLLDISAEGVKNENS